MNAHPLPRQSMPPPALARLFAEAGQHLNRGDYGPAIEVLERAHRLAPDNCKITLDLGYANALAYDFAAAARWFEKAVALAPEKPGMLTAIAERWSDVRQFDASGKTFEQALDHSDAPVGAFYGLAKICARQRRLDKAAEVAERAMQLHGNHEAALLARGKVYREAGQLEEAEKVLRLVVAKPGCPADARATAWYELAALLDRQQRYDEAMAALLEAKTLMRPAPEPARRILQAKQASLRQVQSMISPEIIERWRKIGQSELQPRHRLALLLGHARSGTTLLEYVLDAHPQVISADESSVFQCKAYPVISRARSGNDSVIAGLNWITPRNLRQVRAEYFRGMESFLGQAVGDRLLLDKNPALTADIPAICCILPETKFLVALRDPRDVCLSCFMQPAPVLPDTVPWLSLEDTIKHYILLAETWLALKPCLGSAALEVRYEDLVADLGSCARRALEFLDLGWDERVLRFNEHAQTRTICSPTYAEVTKPVFKTALGRWRHYQKHFEPYLALLAPILKKLGYE
jgi:tetratricopeptide (TPR) repeat protein